jgi:hypothetical protein
MSAVRLLELYRCVFGNVTIPNRKADELSPDDRQLIEYFTLKDVLLTDGRRIEFLAKLLHADAMETLIRNKWEPTSVTYTGLQMNIRYRRDVSASVFVHPPVTSVHVLDCSFDRSNIDSIGKVLQGRYKADWADVPADVRLAVGDALLTLLFGRRVGPGVPGFKIQQSKLTSLLYHLHGSASPANKDSFMWVVTSLWKTDPGRFSLGCDPGLFVFVFLIAFIFNCFSFFFCRLQAKQHC